LNLASPTLALSAAVRYIEMRWRPAEAQRARQHRTTAPAKPRFGRWFFYCLQREMKNVSRVRKKESCGGTLENSISSRNNGDDFTDERAWRLG
jgi:hypothetical protein